MATKQELFDVLLTLHIDMGGYINTERFPESGEVLDNHFKVLVHMLGLEDELATFIQKPRENVYQSAKKAYDKYRAEEAYWGKKAREPYHFRRAIPGTKGNPGHSGNPGHQRNLKHSVAVGAGVSGVVYGLAKWKEDEVKRVFHISPELLALITGSVSGAVFYYA